MADVIRLNHGVLVESFQDEQGASLVGMIKTFASRAKAAWEIATKTSVNYDERKLNGYATLARNGFEPFV